MFISLDEKFTDQAGNIYEVENPVDYYYLTHLSEDRYITYLYDEDGEDIIASTDESEDFPEFYKRGWTKQECHDSLKSDWVPQKDWQKHIDDLENSLDYDQRSWLNLEEWGGDLPTIQAFDDYLGTYFQDAWEDCSHDPDDFEEDTARLVAALEKLTDAMEKDPSLIQAIDPKTIK